MTPDGSISFLDLSTRDELASFLGIELKTLTMYAYSGKSFYTSFDIGKKGTGKSRRIYAPIASLKLLQKRIAEELCSIYQPPACVHGFTSGNSVVTNARRHVGSPVILCLDLKDFFPSITANRIYGLFTAKPLCFSAEVASALTGLCCYQGRLPQGAPTSPVLSNMICLRLDKQLAAFAHERRVFYTRYADDITFSGKSRRALIGLLDAGNPELLCEDLRLIIEKNGFEINASKTHVARRSERQTVTGVIVNKKCNYPREEYRTLRVVFNNWKEKGPAYAAEQYVAHSEQYAERLCLDGESVPSVERFTRHIRGRLEYYSMIDAANDMRSTSLERLWTMYHDMTGDSVSYATPARSVLCIRTTYSYVDTLGRDASFDGDGSCFLTADGMIITCQHCIADKGTPFDLPDDCACEIYEPRKSKPLCSIPVRAFMRDDAADFAVCQAPQALNAFPTLTIGAVNRPVVGQAVRAFGVLYERGEEVREIDCKIDLAHADGMQFRVAAPLIKGMSGGPVVNRRGNVIGIVTRGSAPDEYHYDGYFLWLGAVREGLDDFKERVASKRS